MEKIFLKSSDFDNKKPKYFGIESNIYEYDNGELVKIFKTDEPKILDNKLKKIALLSKMNIPDVKPEKLVYIDNIFKGFSSQERDGYFPIDSLKEKRKEKIEILKKIKEKLEFYHNLGIYYGDLHQENVLYNGKDIIFCDLDNVYLNGYMFDVNNIYIDTYLTFVPTLDKRIDNYALNILTISYYQKISFAYVIEYLRNNPKLEHKLNTEKNYQIIKDLCKLNYKNFDNLLIDNLKRTLIR